MNTDFCSLFVLGDMIVLRGRKGWSCVKVFLFLYFFRIFLLLLKELFGCGEIFIEVVCIIFIFIWMEKVLEFWFCFLVRIYFF